MEGLEGRNKGLQLDWTGGKDLGCGHLWEIVSSFTTGLGLDPKSKWRLGTVGAFSDKSVLGYYRPE